jgi:hypothetical protein
MGIDMGPFITDIQYRYGAFQTDIGLNFDIGYRISDINFTNIQNYRQVL